MLITIDEMKTIEINVINPSIVLVILDSFFFLNITVADNQQARNFLSLHGLSRETA